MAIRPQVNRIGGQLADFCDRLRAERKRLDLNQAALGAAGGVSKDAQLNYESGSRSPDSNYLSAVARVGVDVLYVLTGVRSAQTPQSSEELRLIQAYKDLDSEDRNAIIRIVGSLALKSVD